MRPRKRSRSGTSQSAAGLFIALAIITATPPSEAKESAITPTSASSTAPRPARAWGDVPLAATLGLSIGSTRETLRLSRDDGASSVDTRALMTSRLDLGLNYIVAGIGGERWRLRGQSSLGVGLVYALGEWPLHLRQDLGLELVPRRWFGLFVYGSVGFDINTARPPLSAFVLGLPVGLRFGPVELMARPALRVGLGAEEETIAGATQRRSASTGVAPFEVMLRVRIPIPRRR